MSRTRTVKAPVAAMAPNECLHGKDERSCTSWPNPDKLGRRRCDICHCFTARLTDAGAWRHSWCEKRKWK